MLTFRQSFGPVSAQKIAAVEKRLDVKLPDDYKQFLRTTNGGCPEPNCFSVTNRGDALLAILYGIKDERTNADLEFEQGQAGLWDPLPPGMVAIGHDPGGNIILLETRGKHSGRVYFWDRVGFMVREDGRNTFPVAASFTELLQSLRELPADA